MTNLVIASLLILGIFHLPDQSSEIEFRKTPIVLFLLFSKRKMIFVIYPLQCDSGINLTRKGDLINIIRNKCHSKT